MVCDGDAFVDGKPVALETETLRIWVRWMYVGVSEEGAGGAYDQQHKVLQHVLEMAVSRDGNGAIDERADESPDESRHRLRPSAHDLQAERHAVYIRAVVRNNTQRQDDEAELAEAT